MPLRPANICPGCSELRQSWEETCPCGYVSPEEQARLDELQRQREATINRLRAEGGVKPQIDIDLYSSHGNAFVIMASVTRAMKEWGINREQIAQVMAEAKSHDYEHLVRHLDKYCKLDPVGFDSLDEFFDDYNNKDRRSEEYTVEHAVPLELQEAYIRQVQDALKGARK